MAAGKMRLKAQEGGIAATVAMPRAGHERGGDNTVNNAGKCHYQLNPIKLEDGI